MGTPRVTSFTSSIAGFIDCFGINRNPAQ